MPLQPLKAGPRPLKALTSGGHPTDWPYCDQSLCPDPPPLAWFGRVDRTTAPSQSWSLWGGVRFSDAHVLPPQASPPGFPSGSPVLRLSPCLHRSLEGLNQELEEVFVKEQGEEELLRVSELHPGCADRWRLAESGRGARTLGLRGSGCGRSRRVPCSPQSAEGTRTGLIRLEWT